MLIIDKDDNSDFSWMASEPLENCKIVRVKGGCFADAMKEGLEIWRLEHGEPDWIGYLADDNFPETKHWDTKLLESVKGWNVVNSNDGWQADADINNGRMHGAVIWSGELVRAVGYLFPRGLKHMFTETVWETLGRETKCWQTDISVMVRHQHASLFGEKDETTEHNNSFVDDDVVGFDNWLATEKEQAVEKILSLMDRYGQKIALPDLSGKSVMLATPTGDGRYDRHYIKAWHGTIKLLQDFGVAVEWVEIPYCADLAMARAKLLSTFQCSRFTHLLMIDADMGWEPIDVIRLLRCNKDFVAAAGPMRKYPLQFCVNFPSRGTLVEDMTGAMEVEKVGGAFVMISRACAERMAAAHPELAFTPEKGKIEYALFDPMIVEVAGERLRLSEDYSFCWRWKALGGKIFVLPDIELRHIGPHCFEGALSSILRMPVKHKAVA